MDSKINIEAIEDYSKKFSSKVADNFFSQHAKITGNQILELTNIRQVNLFIIKALFEKWQEETEKLKSPYFDYEDGAVREALQEFMNVLSQHIAIKQADFLPLLENAVKNSLLLIFSPYDFYLLEIKYSQKKGDVKGYFNNLAKYVKVNKPLLNALLASIQKEDNSTLHEEKLTNLFNEVFEQISEVPEDVNPYQSQFSEIVSFDPDMMHDETSSKVKGEGASSEPTSTKSFFEQNENNGNSREHQQQSILNFQQKTLNEQFNSGTSEKAFSSVHKKQKIDNLRNNMGINQRYMFIKELFGNDIQEFHNTINELEKYSSYGDAFGYLKQGIAKKHNWDMESEEVEEFLELLAKRYN